MFWWRKKFPTALVNVRTYAAQLGIERRRNARILYPHQNLNILPSVFYGTHSLCVQDLSIGGACLIDKHDHMGSSAGIEIELRLIWPDCERTVRSRLISRVDVRRHIQFLDIQGDRVEAIRAVIQPGVSGQSMRPVLQPSRGVQLEALELWTSPNGDSLTIGRDVDVMAEIFFNNDTIRLLNGAWPVTADNQALEPGLVEHILLFLFNIPRPTPALLTLREHLRSLYFEGRP